MKTAFVIPFLALFFLFSQENIKCQDVYSKKYESGSINPRIAEIISQINKDSIYNSIAQLCSFGTRSVYAGNRRQVAEWTVEKFASLGYANAVIDSFRIINKYSPYDSIWEYNVSAELAGTSPAAGVYLVTSHPDSYVSNSDPRVLAPGADDDASGVAGMFEIARVLKKAGFHPLATIKFSTLSSEEIHLDGARHYVSVAIQNKEDLRLMLSMDMIAYADSLSFPVSVYQVKNDGSYWTGDLLMQCIQTYTTLAPSIGHSLGGNEIPFLEKGFNTGTIIHKDKYDQYHTVHDSLQYLNMDMCREVTVANCAALLNEHYVPVPCHVTTLPEKDRIGIFWQGRKNATMQGFNIYRSIVADSGYTKINTVVVPDTMFYDPDASPGIIYYYRVSSVNTDGFESTLSNPVNSYRVTLDKELLVVKDARGGSYDAADSLVISFYEDLFKSMTHDFVDASDISSFNPVILGQYKRVAWLSSNLYQFQTPSAFVENRPGIITYLRGKGNLLLVCPQPTYLLASNKTYPSEFSPGVDAYDVFRIKKTSKEPYTLFRGALPVSTGYDSVYVDPAKALPGSPSHIKNIESIEPSPGADIIYVYDTEYDTSIIVGSMKGRPVGIEYLGQDYKLVILSCPLYYMDSLQAHEFVRYVINDKFPPSAGIGEITVNDSAVFQNYPNPVAGETTVRFYLPDKALVSFVLKNLQGEMVLCVPGQSYEPGYNSFKINCSGLAKGLYLGILKTGTKTTVIRIVAG